MSKVKKGEWVSNAEARKLFGYKDASTVSRLAERGKVEKREGPRKGQYLYNRHDLVNAYNNRDMKKVTTPCGPTFPRYDNFLKLKGDYIVVADAHCPLVDWDMFYEQVLNVRDRLKIGKLILAGDTLNCTAFSRFYGLIRIPWQVEKEESRKFLSACGKEFDEIVVLTANHEFRYLLRLWSDYTDKILKDGSQMDAWEVMIARMDDELKKKFEFSVHPQCTINNEADPGWRIVHPSQVRKQPLSFGREMVAIYWQNVIVTHAHMSGWTYAPNSVAQIFDCGVFANPALFDYKNMRITSHYDWTESFIAIKDNEGYLFRKGDGKSVVC